MAVGLAELVESDTGLVDVANYGLRLLRKSERLTTASQITGSFIVQLSLELFGPDILPSANGPFLGTYENLNAILRILSAEIGEELDHIDPKDLVKGNRQSVSNLLELLVSFIIYYSDESLSNFGDTTDMKTPVNGQCRSEVSSDGSHLSHSPELPRSVGRPCLPPSGLQHSLPKSISRTTGDSGLPQTVSSDNTIVPSNKPIRDVVNMRSNRSSSNDITDLRQDSSSPTEMYPQRSQFRHPSILSMQQAISPPTTPKAVDDMMEIVDHQSPTSLAPSLRCSPNHFVPRGTPAQMNSLAEKWSPPSMISLDASNVPSALHTTVVATSHDQSGDYSRSSKDCSVTEYVQTTGYQSTTRRKISSSSSGCGPSPTHTLTVPGVSETSAPSSMCDSQCDAKFEHSEPVVQSQCMPRQPRRPPHRHNSLDAVHDSHNFTSTDSILGWAEDSVLQSKKEPMDDWASLLSSSLYSGTETTGVTHNKPRPSASVLIACSEGFTKALKQRLDYLRTIFCRAHEEAEAVGHLVRAIEMRTSETVGLMHQFVARPRKKSTGTTTQPFEHTLQDVLSGVNLLLDRNHRTPRCCKRDIPLSHKQPSKIHRGSGRIKQRSNPWSNHSSDFEFEQLMELKHKLMVEALQLCYSELNSTTTAKCNPRRLGLV